MSQIHIRMLPGQLSLDGIGLDMRTVQLAAALDGPVLLCLSSDEFTAADKLQEKQVQHRAALMETSSTI
jgi:hypothetical protein